MLVGFAVVSMTVPRRAPAGTIAEQRARLPPPVNCDDPVSGLWKSHDYRPARQLWSIFPLQIERVGTTDELRGTIHSHGWYGDAAQSEPGVCRGRLHYTISMDAQGQVTGDTMAFGGTGQWRLDALPCGESLSAYNLDRFTGPLDLDALEFQSVNNDGGASVNAPTVFRRVECLQGAAHRAVPVVKAARPAFYPPTDQAPASGCGVQ